MAYYRVFTPILKRRRQAGGDPSPVINWDFLQSQSLTSFSRTSNATLFDSTGKLTYAPNNTAVNSAVYNTNWTLAGISSITTGVSDPVGGTAASSMVEDGTTGLHRIYSGASSCFTAVAGVSYLVSLDIKPGTRTWTRLFLGGGPINGGLGVYAYFNLSGAGSVGTSTATSPGVVQLANGWYRAYFKVTAGSAGLTALYIEGATADTVNSYAGSNGATALSVYNLVAAAVTHETTPRSQDQVITTANPYYGPRYPYAYNGTTWDAQGLLVEAAGTNLLTYSDQFDNGAWIKTASGPPTGVTPNAVISPDGTQNADLIYPSSTAYQGGSLYRATTTGTVVSIYAKAAGFNYLCLWNAPGTAPAAWFNLSNGTLGTVVAGHTATIINAGNGWYRCSLRKDDNMAFVYVQVQAVNADNSATPTASGTNGIYIYGAQLEAGDQATSYIPNLSTGTTQRNADTSLAFSAISLPTGLSFSRASNAMQYDAAGRLTYAPNNLLTYSEDFRDTAAAGSTRPWLRQQILSSNTTAVSPPSGIGTVNIITDDGTTNVHQLNHSFTPSTSNFIVSVYGKYIDNPWIFIGYFTYGCAFNIQTGTAGTPTSNAQDPNIVDVGGGWYRCSIRITASVGADAVYVGLSNANAYRPSYAGTGKAAYVTGGQVEDIAYETLPRPYNIATSSAYYGPRYDYDPLTRLPKGLLIEEGRTNIATDTETFTGWTVGATAVNTGVTSPSGSTSKKLDELATTAEHTLYLDKASQTTATFSCYMKMAERRYASLRLYNALSETLTVVFDLLSGVVTQTTNQGTTYTSVTSDIVPVGNGWFRCFVTSTRSSGTTYYCLNLNTTGTPTLPANGGETYLGVANSGIYIFGAQLEAGSFPTSYIPNPGIASGIRSADIATWTSAAISSYYNKDQGSAIVEVSHDLFGGVNNTIFGSSTNGYNLRHDGTRIRSSIRGVVDLITTTGPVVSSIPYRAGGTYQSGGNAVTLNGGAAVTASTTFTASSAPTGIGVGYDNLSASNYLNGHLRRLAYYNVKLADAKLQTKSVVGATL